MPSTQNPTLEVRTEQSAGISGGVLGGAMNGTQGIIIVVAIIVIVLLCTCGVVHYFNKATERYRQNMNMDPSKEKPSSIFKYPNSPFVTYKSNYPSRQNSEYFTRDDIEIDKLATVDDMADIKF